MLTSKPQTGQVAARINEGLTRLDQLPILPATAQCALKLADAPDCSTTEFAKLIEQDVALAARVVKLANSPLYSWGKGIDTISNAVTRLGLRKCRELILAEGVRGLGRRAMPELRGRCDVLWQHSFLVACLCRLLSEHLNHGCEGEEFTAGLMHDLGRILVAILAPAEFLRADPMTFEEGPSLLENEREVLGIDHCLVGIRYAQVHRLPTTVAAAMRHHHRVSDAAQCRGLVALVAAADHLANFLHQGGAVADYDLSGNDGFADLSRGWDDRRLARFCEALPEMLAGAQRALQQTGM